MSDTQQVSFGKIAFLGAGSMGGAILAGLVASGAQLTGGIWVTNRTSQKAKQLTEAYPTDSVTSLALDLSEDANQQAVSGASVIIIGVKPAMVSGLLTEIAPHVAPNAVVVSVAAGVPVASLLEHLPEGAQAVRAMPNTPALVGSAITGLSGGPGVSAESLSLVRAIFQTVGEVIEVPEEQLDQLSAVSGSGPAYFFYFVELLVASAVSLGFSQQQASQMVEGTFTGAAKLLAASQESPASLRQKVTSPGGTTQQAISVFEAADIQSTIDAALAAAIKRSKELAAG